MKKRLVWFFAALLFAFGGVIVRFSRLIEDESLQAAHEQSSVTVTVAQVRGTIYDCQLTPLTNVSTHYRAGIVSTPKAMTTLSETLSSQEWEELRTQLQSGKPVVWDLPFAVAPVAGVSQFAIPDRYEEEQLAAHVVGYVKDGITGVYGMEKVWDDFLMENSGSVTVTYRTDANGQVLQGGEIVVNNTLYHAQAGVVLTLDARLQNIVENVAAPLLDKGAVVIMKPDTGAIVAMASFPDFEPSQLETYLQSDSAPLFNRAIAAYNCGSVFKIASVAAALEAGVPNTQTFYCRGSLAVGANVIKCHHVLGHGKQAMADGFVNSCNPYFIQLLQLAGGSSLYRMASAMGFDRSLQLGGGYATAAAVFPAEKELLQPTTLANVSFGQGALVATPVHIAHMTAAVVNGGVAYSPTLVRGTVDAAGMVTETQQQAPLRLFSPKTAQELQAMMIRVVNEGTGASARPSTGGAGGKTGTAQTGWVSENGETMVQSWFTGFYPAENPQYVITVLSEDGGNTKKNAAPVFRKLCDELARAGYTDA